MFWVYSYKGFSRTAARTVRTALVLAGRQGCCQADTAICCWRWCRRHAAVQQTSCAANGSHQLCAMLGENGCAAGLLLALHLGL